MQMLLSQALERAGDGSPSRGEVRVDGHNVRLFRSTRGDQPAWSENSLFAPEIFVDQEVEFDDHGVAEVRDVHGRMRQVRIRVLVPISPVLRAIDLLSSAESGG
jgi:hypothetical protein